MVLVPGCLFDISSHKVSPNSKGWASLKKGANLKIYGTYQAYPSRCRRLFEEGGIWVSILRPSMFYLEIAERTRLKIKTAGVFTSSAGGCRASALACALRLRAMLAGFRKEKENIVC